MALANPLSRAAFMSTLRPLEASFAAPRAVQHTPLRSGDVLSAEVAPALWMGSVRLAPMRDAAADDVLAILDWLTGPGRYFEAFRLRTWAPRLDPDGSGLGAATPQIAAVDLSASTLALSGLPAGYEISRGDLISFSYDSGRQALHRFSEAGTADGTGALAALTVTPHIRSGASAGASVQLVRPWCLAQIVPGSVSPGVSGRDRITSGIAFDFIQSLKAV